MTTNAKITGNIVIGSGTKTMTIPIDSVLPPPTTGKLIFTYSLPAGTAPTSFVSVDDFLTWATNSLKLPDLKSLLPTSLVALSIGVSTLNIDTGGTFDIGVLFGSDTNGVWSPTWKPIDALPFEFTDLELEVDYTSA